MSDDPRDAFVAAVRNEVVVTHSWEKKAMSDQTLTVITKRNRHRSDDATETNQQSANCCARVRPKQRTEERGTHLCLQTVH